MPLTIYPLLGTRPRAYNIWKMVKIGVNIFYPPPEPLRAFLGRNRDFYVPIASARSLKGDEWCRENAFYDDSSEDNISGMNARLNENTAVYWMWKNMGVFSGADFVGLNHYRRFFPRSRLEEALRGADAAVAEPIRCGLPLAQQYAIYHELKDLETCAEVLRRRDPAFGAGFVRHMVEDRDNFAPMNMFAMKPAMFRKWCEFVFPVLFELCERIDTAGRDNYQKRAVCFLEERVFGYWCMRARDAGAKVAEVKVEEHLDWKDNGLNERGTY